MLPVIGLALLIGGLVAACGDNSTENPPAPTPDGGGVQPKNCKEEQNYLDKSNQAQVAAKRLATFKAEYDSLYNITKCEVVNINPLLKDNANLSYAALVGNPEDPNVGESLARCGYTIKIDPATPHSDVHFVKNVNGEESSSYIIGDIGKDYPNADFVFKAMDVFLNGPQGLYTTGQCKK